MSASSQCPHSDLHINVHHQAFGDCSIHYLEIRAHCKICDRPVVFRGCPLGMTPAHPTMALDGSEVRLPFLVGDDELTGKGIGFVGTTTLTGS